MQLRALTAVILGSAACALALSGCGSSAVVLGPLAQAADVTAHAGGAHMQLSARVEAGGNGISMNGSGYFNYSSREGTFTVQVSGPPAAALGSGEMTIQEIFKGSKLYLSSPLLTGKLPNGATWMSVDLARAAKAEGLDPTQLLGGQSNPAQLLEYLKASGASVAKVGTNRIRGVPTTHYTATINLQKAAGALAGGNAGEAEKAISKLGLGSMPVDVWVDSHKLVRRMQMTLHAPIFGQNLQMVMDIEMFGFGSVPTVTPPPASETFEATSSALSGLDSQ